MNDTAIITAYHQRTKHHLDRYARGPANLDWDAQPAAFRSWRETRYYNLPRTPPELAACRTLGSDSEKWAGAACLQPEIPKSDRLLDIPWPELAHARAAAPCDVAHLATLLRLSVALTAWKQYGEARWSLRAHPSSGNLHPTETWVLAYWVEGLPDGLYHYHNQHHTLEWRAETLAAADTPGLWFGFTSIHWREAWKYGERAFRYCQLDLGHVLAALAHAAALLGWQARLVPLTPTELAHCLGTDRAEDYAGVEPEEAEVIVALQPLTPQPGQKASNPELPPLEWDEWSGIPTLLDPNPLYQWPEIEEVAIASRGTLPPAPLGEEGKTVDPASSLNSTLLPHPQPLSQGEKGAAEVILKRRSAQAFDGRTVMPQAVFRRILAALLPGHDTPAAAVWRMWPHAPRIHPALLIHRVEGVAPGLYLLPRSETGLTELGRALRPEFTWEIADPALPLYRLIAASAERTARTLSCHQDIASHSAFTLMFIAEFADAIAANPAAYRHLHWEAGMCGHCATLAAEAAGWRATGIGCFFDDADHEVLGLTGTDWQVIYHTAIGMALEDPRLLTLPAYDAAG